jgi:hypothetical protein
MVRRLLGAAIISAAVAAPAVAQTAPPIPRPGTMVLPGNAGVYDAGEAAVEGVARGVKAIKDKFGAKAPLVDPLGGLLEGSTVVIRKGLPPAEVVEDDSEETNVTEATVTHIEKVRTQLTVRFDDGSKASLQFAGTAGSDSAAKAAASKSDVLSLTYTDDSGRKATRVFTKIS